MLSLYYDWTAASTIEEYKEICQKEMDALCKMGFESFNWVDNKLSPLSKRLYKYFLFRTAEILNELGFDEYHKKYNDIYKKSEVEIEKNIKEIEDGYNKCLKEKRNHIAIRELEKISDKIFEVKSAGAFCISEPKVYGLLGIHYYKAFRIKLSLYYTNSAMEMCRRINDNDGVRVYERNTEMIMKRKNRFGRIVIDSGEKK